MIIDKMDYIFAIAKEQNLTRAAKRLFVAQSTLSKQIALLEEELGLKLFYRNNRTVSLTPAGSLFRGEMEKVEHRLTEAIDRARHVDRGLDGHLSIGVLDIIDPSLFVTPLLRLFQARYPKGRAVRFSVRFFQTAGRVGERPTGCGLWQGL